MSNLPKISYSDGGVHVTVDLRALDQRMREAQQWLGDRVLEDCKACMPLLTGSLQQRSHTEDDGKKVIFPGPYARYQYGGKVMVDTRHTREDYIEILDVIDKYEKYCDSHKDYENNRAVHAIANIERCYDDRLKNNDFA